MSSQVTSAERPVRVTSDLEPELFDGFRDLAHRNRVHQTKILRALVQVLLVDESVASRAIELAREYAEVERGAHRRTGR